MNIEEYEKSGRALYERFAATVAAILRAALDEAAAIKVQQVQHRAKDVASLTKKLAKRNHDAAHPIQASAKDLAGCRIVVYSNDDVARIGNSRLLVDNFDVDWERTRVHQPGAADNASQFISNNYVVKLKDDRAGLPEYRAYAGLWCEVQVQTILNHAWAATAHDTIYKQPDLDGIGKAHMERINRRMTKIMEDYLKPAGFEFQKVLDDFERLAAGKQLIDTEILKAIRDATDNNDRDRLIEQFRENVLPLYDDPSKVYPEVRSTMLDAVAAAAATETVPLETGIGLMRGRTPEDVMRRVVDVLDDLRYVDVGETFNAYVTLVGCATSDAERKIVRDAVERLARYLLPVWRNHGPAAQMLLLDAIEALDAATRDAVRPLLTEACGQCLDLDITGTTSTSKTISWHTAAVVPTEHVVNVRNRARAILTGQLERAGSDDEWRDIVASLGQAARLPHGGWLWKRSFDPSDDGFSGECRRLYRRAPADAELYPSGRRGPCLRASPSVRGSARQPARGAWRAGSPRYTGGRNPEVPSPHRRDRRLSDLQDPGRVPVRLSLSMGQQRLRLPATRGLSRRADGGAAVVCDARHG
jgi:ppGpp synthetase/RelA/SpoT-type nucleotidyltranferase